jgi:hypothetical protein
MDQKAYSDYILSRLLKEFPQFIDYYIYKDDIVIIEYPSKAGLVKLWITTQDLELTIGLEGKVPKWDWHTHMSLFSAYEPDDELREASQLIKNILIGNEYIVSNSELGYSISDNPDKAIENRMDNEIVEIKKWFDL